MNTIDAWTPALLRIRRVVLMNTPIRSSRRSKPFVNIKRKASIKVGQRVRSDITTGVWDYGKVLSIIPFEEAEGHNTVGVEWDTDAPGHHYFYSPDELTVVDPETLCPL